MLTQHPTGANVKDELTQGYRVLISDDQQVHSSERLLQGVGKILRRP